jgi:uncharacterized membrane protein (DUF485 family)
LADAHERLRVLHDARWRIALTLTAVMIVMYFGFITLIAYDKEFLSRIIVPGLSIGILLGALVIVASWLLTWVYVRWANRHYDVELRALQASGREAALATEKVR